MPVISEDNIILRIIAETQKASREIDQLDKKVDGLEGSTNSVNEQFAKLGKFAKNAAIVALLLKATKGMAQFASNATKAYAELEKSETSLKVLVGDVGTARDLMKDLRRFAAQSPFGTQGLIKASTTLLGFGRNVKQVKDDIRILGELAAVSGASIENMALVYGQIASLGKLQGNDVMQLINAQIPIYDLLSKSMNKSVAELKELQSQGKITFAEVEKAMRQATEEGGMFHGAIEQQSKTIAGLRSTLADTYNEVLANFGEKFAPVVRAAYQLLITALEKINKALAESDSDFFINIAAGISTAATFMDDFTTRAVQSARIVQKAWAPQMAVIQALMKSPGTWLKLWKGDLSGFVKEIKGGAGNLGSAIQDFLTAPIDLAQLYKDLSGDIPMVKAVFRKVKAELKEELDSGANLFGETTTTADLILGDPKKTENDLAKGIEVLVKSALKAYAIATRELLGRTKAGLESTLQQRKEAQILSVFLARDLADMSAQEFRNFHKYASEALGSDNLITLMIEGYLKDAEGKEIDQDLVARIGGKLTDSIAKWTKKQKTGDDKKGFLQNLFGMSDKEFEDLKYTSDIILQSAVELTNSLVNEEIRRTDLLIQASRDRLQQLQTTASQGNAEQLQLEEERQRKLIEQRESYLQRQRQLNAIEITANNAVIVSNMIKGLSDAFKAGNIFGGIAYSIAAAATIATTIASVNAALASVPAYWKGTEFVTGEGGIDNVPAMLSRGERVVDRNTNSTLNRWGVKNDDLLPLVGSALGKYGPVSLFQGENVSRREFKELSGKLERVEKAIYGIQFNVNIDPDGIGVAAGNYRNRQSKRNKLLS